jgi:GntR family transcriptional regulator
MTGGVVRSIRYREIAESLRARVDGGEFPSGRLLPSEAELSISFGASRVTVRRALELLRDEGLLDARQGVGWFVAGDPLRQSLGRLATIESQLAASGLRPERRILEFAFVPAEPRVRLLLGTEQVLKVRRLNLADDEPFALVTVWCPAHLAEHLSRAAVERSPFYELLEVPLGGATQTIGAAAAEPSDADDHPVLLSVHIFPGHRTEFLVDLPQAEQSIAPTGLRLVE